MIPWQLIDSTDLGDGSALELWRRPHEGRQPDFSMRLTEPGRPLTELMNSRQRASEQALALRAFAALGRAPKRVLIGGLGMGFTLKAALAELPAGASAVVAELLEAVVRWNEAYFTELDEFAGGSPVHDSRVTLRLGDVRDAYRLSPKAPPYDVILLDTDNGPEGTTRNENESLYSVAGLQEARAALAPGGVLAVWSAFPSEAFTATLKRAGFKVRVVTERAAGKRGARHTIWLASKP